MSKVIQSSIIFKGKEISDRISSNDINQQFLWSDQTHSFIDPLLHYFQTTNHLNKIISDYNKWRHNKL